MQHTDSVQLKSNQSKYLPLLCSFYIATWRVVYGRGSAEAVVAIISTLRGVINVDPQYHDLVWYLRTLHPNIVYVIDTTICVIS